jgi:hypothetical protein
MGDLPGLRSKVGGGKKSLVGSSAFWQNKVEFECYPFNAKDLPATVWVCNIDDGATLGIKGKKAGSFEGSFAASGTGPKLRRWRRWKMTATLRAWMWLPLKASWGHTGLSVKMA